MSSCGQNTYTINPSTVAKDRTVTGSLQVNGNAILGNASADLIGFYGSTGVVRGATLTAQLTTLTIVAPTVADYSIAAPTNTTPFGFVTADEMNSTLAAIANLQVRVAQLQARLNSATGVGIIT